MNNSNTYITNILLNIILIVILNQNYNHRNSHVRSHKPTLHKRTSLEAQNLRVCKRRNQVSSKS